MLSCKMDLLIVIQTTLVALRSTEAIGMSIKPKLMTQERGQDSHQGKILGYIKGMGFSELHLI